MEQKKHIFKRLELVLSEKGIVRSRFLAKIGVPAHSTSQYWTNWRERGIPPAWHKPIIDELKLSYDWFTEGNGEKYAIVPIETQENQSTFDTDNNTDKNGEDEMLQLVKRAHKLDSGYPSAAIDKLFSLNYTDNIDYKITVANKVKDNMDSYIIELSILKEKGMDNVQALEKG